MRTRTTRNDVGVLLVLGGGAVLNLVGCSDAPASARSQEGTTQQTQQAIVKGTPSTAARDAVVKLVLEGSVQCTGSLIAPDLVLTARHCVAAVNDGGECGTFGQNLAPSSLSIVVGAGALDSSTPVAVGTKIFDDGVPDACGHDLALLQLDRKIAGAKLATIRFSKATAGEPAVVVGYGDNERNTHQHLREERSVTLAAIGPAQATHTPQTGGAPIPYNLPAGEIATGQGSCPGDSGGPLFDAQNRILGVVSRGLGLACGADQATVFSATEAFTKIIMAAAQAVGQPITPETGSTPGGPGSGGPGPAPKGGAAGEDDHEDGDEHAEHGEEGHVHEDGDEHDGETKKKKSVSAAPAQGCSVGPSSSSGSTAMSFGTPLVLLGVLKLLRRRRARRPAASSSSST